MLASVGRKFVKKLRMSRELSVQSTVTISGKYDDLTFAGQPYSIWRASRGLPKQRPHVARPPSTISRRLSGLRVTKATWPELAPISSE